MILLNYFAQVGEVAPNETELKPSFQAPPESKPLWARLLRAVSQIPAKFWFIWKYSKAG
jgi:hypothetical protein